MVGELLDARPGNKTVIICRFTIWVLPIWHEKTFRFFFFDGRLASSTTVSERSPVFHCYSEHCSLQWQRLRQITVMFPWHGEIYRYPFKMLRLRSRRGLTIIPPYGHVQGYECTVTIAMHYPSKCTDSKLPHLCKCKSETLSSWWIA